MKRTTIFIVLVVACVFADEFANLIAKTDQQCSAYKDALCKKLEQKAQTIVNKANQVDADLQSLRTQRAKLAGQINAIDKNIMKKKLQAEGSKQSLKVAKSHVEFVCEQVKTNAISVDFGTHIGMSVQQIAKLKKQIASHEKNGNFNAAANLKKTVNTLNRSVATLKKIEAPRHQIYPASITSADDAPKPLNPPADPSAITVKDWYVSTGPYKVVNARQQMPNKESAVTISPPTTWSRISGQQAWKYDYFGVCWGATTPVQTNYAVGWAWIPENVPANIPVNVATDDRSWVFINGKLALTNGCCGWRSESIPSSMFNKGEWNKIYAYDTNICGPGYIGFKFL